MDEKHVNVRARVSRRRLLRGAGFAGAALGGARLTGAVSAASRSGQGPTFLRGQGATELSFFYHSTGSLRSIFF